MSDPQRIAVLWSPEARTELRAIDRETAMQILYCVDRYLSTRAGDVKKLKPPRTDFRLRCADYRVFFGCVASVSRRSDRLGAACEGSGRHFSKDDNLNPR